MRCVSRPERIAGWMRQHLVASGARGFILGLSGGVDSAVVLRLSQLAAPNAIIAAILPCHSDPRDEEDASLVATHFSAPTIRVDLSTLYDTAVTTLQTPLNTVRSRARLKTCATSVPNAPDVDRMPLASIK